MERWKESQLRQLTFAKKIETAYPILLEFSQKIGFQFCSVTVASTHPQAHFNTVQINNFSDDWKRRCEEDTEEETDPVTSHCKDSMMPFIWSKSAYGSAPKRWRALQLEGAKHGWSQAFHHAEHRLCGILSLARPDCTVNTIEVYEHFGCLIYAISHITDLFANTLPKPGHCQNPQLSPRELEVVKLSALGKTAHDISRILNLSERTVNYHVQNVILKFKVCNKISAVIAAARAGII
jgi:LuxR family transcriptional regulator